MLTAEGRCYRTQCYLYEKMTKGKGYKKHHCQESPGKDIEIISAGFNEETGEKQWWFHLYREATEKNLEVGEADQIGELMFSRVVVIAFCPFYCKRLRENNYKTILKQ